MERTDCDVVIVAPMDDLHAHAVIDALKRQGGTVALASLRHLTSTDSLSIHGNGSYGSTLQVGGRTIDLDRVGSVWWRRPQNPVGRPDGSATQWFKHQEWESFLFSLEAACGCTWVNRPSRQWVSRRKGLQMAVAAKLGLRTPETLITNSPDEVRAFSARFPRTIYKSMGDTAHENTGTRFLTAEDLERLDWLAHCPAIFQEHIAATCDIRVTIIGDRLFPVRIDSQQGQSRLDWRFDHSVGFEPCRLDPATETKLLRLMRELGLTYGAADLRRTPEGEEVFLEVNPAGQYLFAELLTGLEISDALAAELLRARRGEEDRRPHG